MTENIKVEKGVPMPVSRRMASYPWDEMEIGDSFFVALDGKKPGNSAVRRAVTYRQKHVGGRYCTRTFTENGVKGIRVWRIE